MDWNELDFSEFEDPVGFRLYTVDKESRLMPFRRVRNLIEDNDLDYEGEFDMLKSLERNDSRFVVDASEVEDLERLESDIREILRNFNTIPSPQELYEEEKELESKGIVGRNYEYTLEKAERVVENMKEDYYEVELEVVSLS